MADGGDDRRGAIVAAASGLFARRGFAAVGIDDIGAAVGISGPAIYRHFAGKDGVFEAVVRSTLERLDSDIGSADAVTSPPGEAVAHVVDAALASADGLAALLREPERLALPLGERDSADAPAFVQRLFDAVTQRHPALDTVSTAIRVRALFAPLTSVVLRPAAVSPRRQRELFLAGATAVLETPGASIPAPIATPTWKPAGTRRDDILRAALTLFRARGYHGVGVQEIAEAAGMSAATMYHYYESKSDILVDAYDRVDHRVVAGALDALDGARSATDALARLAQSYTRLAIDNVDLTLVTSREASALPADDRPRRSRGFRLTVDAWLTSLREVHPELPEAELGLLVNSAMMLIQHGAQLSESNPLRTDEIAALAVAQAMCPTGTRPVADD